jgi:ribonucleoside-diphosphate reductase alpha chain
MENKEQRIKNARDLLSEERKTLQEQGKLPEWFTTDGWALFKGKYAYKGEEAFLGRAKTIAKTAAKHLPEELQNTYELKFFNLLWNGWLSCSTPVLSNMGTDRGLSVSCSGQYVGDSVDEFYSNYRETALLSKYGFGTSAYLGDIRPRGAKMSIGGKASGVQPVYEDFVNVAKKISQGSNRRGAWAGYLPLMHPDFDELADYVKKNPDDCNIGWCITAQDVEDFKDVNSEASRRRAKVMKLKMLTGKGYFVFPDKINAVRPQMYKDLGLEVKSSNLCTEITLFQDEEHTYTCVLASMNLYKYPEWKDTTAIFDATVFLDCVASDFISKGRNIPGLEKAVRFTEKGRALGLGVMGFHSYLQSQGVPFESLEAQFINQELFQELHDKTLEASQWMAKKLGEPEWCKGYGVRNTHRTAIAPTMSTAAIMGGVSQGIEPMIGNVFVADLAGGEIIRVNPVFLDVIKAKGLYDDVFLKDIVDHDGSIQHRSEFTPEEKLLWRTPFEMYQTAIIDLAVQRQPYICQAQSINTFFGADDPEQLINSIHRYAFEHPMCLSLYYIRTKAGVSASNGECAVCQ